MNGKQNLIAYLSTIGGIVFLATLAALICIMANFGHELPQIIAALGFISAAIAGLTGIAGTFKGQFGQQGMSEDATKKVLDKVPPTE